MSPQDRVLFQRMAAELAELRRDTRLIPARWARTATTYYMQMLSGNLLATIATVNYYGLKQPASNITTVPTVVPSTTSGATPDGLSPAYLLNDAGTTTLVWAGVRLSPPSGPIYEYAGVLTRDSAFLARTIVQMPLATDSSVLVPVYSAWRI